MGQGQGQGGVVRNQIKGQSQRRHVFVSKLGVGVQQTQGPHKAPNKVAQELCGVRNGVAQGGEAKAQAGRG